MTQLTNILAANSRLFILSAVLLVFGCEEISSPAETINVDEETVDQITTDQASKAATYNGGKLFEFKELVGVPRPFTGSDNPIRGVSGGGLPWVIDKGKAQLSMDGKLRVEVKGLVLDPNDQAVIDNGLAGVNPVGQFKAILSCLSVDGNGEAVEVNVETGTVPATTGLNGGDAKIAETLDGIPDPCIAPIVFVTSPRGSWFAASGF